MCVEILNFRPCQTAALKSLKNGPGALILHGCKSQNRALVPWSLSRHGYTTTTRHRADVFPSQIQDLSSTTTLSSQQNSSRVPQTLTEKIVQRYSVGLAKDKYVQAGDYVTLSPHHVMTHDNSWPVALKFMAIGASKIHNREQIVMTLDHDVQNKSESNLKKYRQIEEFAKQQGVGMFYADLGSSRRVLY